MKLERRSLSQPSNHNPCGNPSIPAPQGQKPPPPQTRHPASYKIQDCPDTGCSGLIMAPTFDIVVAMPVSPGALGTW